MSGDTSCNSSFMDGVSTSTSASSSKLKAAFGVTRGRSSSSSSTWKQLPGALIEGVKHRFKEKRSRSKSPEWDWRRRPPMHSEFVGPPPQPLPPPERQFGGGGGGLTVLGCLPSSNSNNAHASSSTHRHNESPAPPYGVEVIVPPPRADTLPRLHSQMNGNNEPAPLVRSNSTGTTASVTSSDYGFGSNNANRATAAVLQRGVKQPKSVRFGENRISVFMQDPNNALEDIVKLALGYSPSLGDFDSEDRSGLTMSDSEAVVSSKAMSPHPGFWSDTERDPRLYETEDDEAAEDDDEFRRGFSAAAAALAALSQQRDIPQRHPADRESYFAGTNGSSLLFSQQQQQQQHPSPIPPPPSRRYHHHHQHHRSRRSPSPQINTLLPHLTGSGDAKSQEQKTLLKNGLTEEILALAMAALRLKQQQLAPGEQLQSAQIKEIVAFIDSVLSACDFQALSTSAAASSTATDVDDVINDRAASSVMRPEPQKPAPSLPAKKLVGTTVTASAEIHHPPQPPTRKTPISNSNRGRLPQSSWPGPPTSLSSASRHTTTSSCSTSTCSYRPSNSSSLSSSQPTTTTGTSSRSASNLTPEEALAALRTLTKMSSKAPASASASALAFSDSDCDEDDDDISSVLSVASSLGKKPSVRPPSRESLLTVTNGVTDKQNRLRRKRREKRRLRRYQHLQQKQQQQKQLFSNADVFATVLLCAEENSSRCQSGVSSFRHVHSKITQDVCNAIFLCKVRRETQEKKKKN